MLVVKLAGTHVDGRRFPSFSTFVADASFTCRMVVIKPADKRRFPAAAPDTMPFMIGDDGRAAGAGILRPRLDVPELAEALLPTAQIPIKMAALTKFILFLCFILPFQRGRASPVSCGGFDAFDRLHRVCAINASTHDM